MKKRTIQFLLILMAALVFFLGQFSTVALAAGQEATLTIAGGSNESWTQAVTDAFAQLYPEVSIAFADMEGAVEKETYEQAVLSGSDACDIYLLSGNADLKGLINRGLAAPLPDEVLQADVQAMDWALTELVTNEAGVLCALPITLYPNYTSVRADLLAETGLGEVPETVNDYVDLMVKWYTEEDFAPAREQYRFDEEAANALRNACYKLLYAYIHAYTHCDLMPEGQALTYNTPALREALTQLLPLAAVETEAVDDEDARVCIFEAPLYLGWMDEEETLCPLAFTAGEQAAIEVVPVVAVVNPNSQKRAEAIAFLRCLVENRTAEEQFALHPFDAYEGENEAMAQIAPQYRQVALKTFCVDCLFYRWVLFTEMDAWEVLSPYFAGEADVEDVLKELDALVSEALAR